LQQGYTPGSGGRNILSEGSLIISKTQILSGTYSGIFDFPGGAGILNYDEMTIINSTIAYNHTESAAEGGGIYNLGSLTLENATLTNNIDVPYVFGISTSGIYNNGSVFITNSTISNTITNEFGGSTTLQNTIIMFCKGANYISQDYNLSSADNCNLTQTNDITSTNPLLAPPSNNGGSILTNALLFGSPAVDAASNNSCPLTDQRGIQRPIDGNGDGVAVCDIGAFEAPEAITIVIDNPTVIESANIISFTIMLSDSPIESVSVAYSTADITATAFTDYIPVSGTLFFNSGEISQTIQVAILNDTLDEADETFAVNLSDPINAFIIEGQGIGVIKDDDYQLFLPTITK
jgi:hypothetical protein